MSSFKKQPNKSYSIILSKNNIKLSSITQFTISTLLLYAVTEKKRKLKNKKKPFIQINKGKVCRKKKSKLCDLDLVVVSVEKTF